MGFSTDLQFKIQVLKKISNNVPVFNRMVKKLGE